LSKPGTTNESAHRKPSEDGGGRSCHRNRKKANEELSESETQEKSNPPKVAGSTFNRYCGEERGCVEQGLRTKEEGRTIDPRHRQ